MEVILIRHGIAEEGTADKPDSKRELTPKGIDKLNQLFPLFKQRLTENNMTRIWSSPLIRAHQTAALLADHLLIDDVELVDFLAFGEYELFRQAINEQDLRARIIMVGHEPTLSQWILDLTNENLRVSKGMIISILVDDKAPRQGHINYILDPKVELK